MLHSITGHKRLERLARDKHSSLLRALVNYGREKFYSIGPEHLSRSLAGNFSSVLQSPFSSPHCRSSLPEINGVYGVKNLYGIQDAVYLQVLLTRLTPSGCKPTHLTPIFSPFLSSYGTTLTAFGDIIYGCLRMLDGLVSTHLADPCCPDSALFKASKC